MYVALDSPRTVTELAAESGLAESSVKAHLRTLGRFGLVRQSPDAGLQGTYVQASTLSESLREQVEAKVTRAGMALPAAPVATQPPPRTSPSPSPAPTSGSEADRSNAPASGGKRLWAVAGIASCVLGLVVFLQLGSPGDDDGTGRSTAGQAASPTPSVSTPTRRRIRPSRTPAPTVEAAPPEPVRDPTLDEKADRLAASYGYTLPSDPPGTGAGLAQTTCSRAADGWDYETAVADDISVGAPESVAVGWNSFVYEEYCPAY